MNTREGRKKLFRVASQMSKVEKDVQVANFMKNKNGNILVEQTAVADRWKRCFEQLLNDEFENDIDVVLYTEGHVKHITEFGMQKVIQGMKIGELRDRHICEC